MTTFAPVIFVTAESSKVIEDGQAASTSDSQINSYLKQNDLESITHLRRIRQALFKDNYAESINIPLTNNAVVSDEYRQRYRAKSRRRMHPPERIDPAIRRRRRRRHRQRIQRYLRKLKQNLQLDGAYKTTKTEVINEELCATERRIVQLNYDTIYEFHPGFYEEVRCKSSAPENQNTMQKNLVQKYFDGILRCVQITKDMYFTRIRKGEYKGDVHIIPQIPVGCQAMWPADQWGHQEL